MPVRPEGPEPVRGGMLGANRSSARSIVKTYVVQQPGKGEIRYQDRKRYLWLLSVLFPLLPFVGMALMAERKAIMTRTETILPP